MVSRRSNRKVLTEKEMKKLLKQVVENAAPSMKAQLLKLGSSSFAGKISKSSWRRIPTVSSVNIPKGEWNSILEKVGLHLRTPREIGYTLKSTKSMNRYMEHQIIRMRKAQGTPLFWVIANFCLTKSVSFRVSAIIHVIPSWWYAWSKDSMKMLNQQVTKILKNHKSNLNFRRVYIEKADGKYRPLGVPSPSWRIALHMLNNIITLSAENSLLDCQHGYIPGRGTLSAWRDVLTNIIDKPFIFESDLKNFFGEVLPVTVDFELKKLGMPDNFRNWFFLINQSYPKLPKNLKLPEKLPTKGTRQELNDLAKMHFFEYDKVGLAQGAPTSAFCSILTLKDYLSQTKYVVNYADDQIFASYKNFFIWDDPTSGIVHADNKTRWIRVNGKWLREIKFLGLIYNPWDKTLRSETRSERRIGIDQNLIDIWDCMTYSKKDDYLTDLATRNIFGYVQACLYQGSFKTDSEMIKVQEQKGHTEKLIKSNTKSWMGGYQKDLTNSSNAIEFLAGILRKQLKKH